MGISDSHAAPQTVARRAENRSLVDLDQNLAVRLATLSPTMTRTFKAQTLSEAHAKPPGKVVMVCWNASREAARAVVDALPFLRAAEKVIVLAVNPEMSAAGHGAEPGADVAAWLSRHGVRVTVQRDVAPDADVGAVILSRAADHGVDLIVMGIYGHSRMREMVLGGASRSLLASMTVPVLMAH